MHYTNNSVTYYVNVSLELFSVISNFDILPYDPIFSDIYKPISLPMCIAKAANNDIVLLSTVQCMYIGPTTNDLSRQNNEQNICKT
jgi:hypothetical protein